jgi:hypothetical protein
MDFSSVRVPDPKQSESLAEFVQDLQALSERCRNLLSVFPKKAHTDGMLTAHMKPDFRPKPFASKIRMAHVCSFEPDGGDRIEYNFLLEEGTCSRCHYASSKTLNETSVSWDGARKEILDRTREFVSQPLVVLANLRQFVET